MDKRIVYGLVAAAVVVLGVLGYLTFGGSPALDSPGGGVTTELRPDDRIHGSPDAPITIIEYASMTCTHCARFHKDVMPKLTENYIDTGKVKLVVREFPLDAWAAAGSVLATCVPEDNYFAFIDLLFVNQAKWAFGGNPKEGLVEMGRFAGLNREQVEACLKKEDEFKRIQGVASEAQSRYGVEGTPTFIIGGEIYRAELTYERLEEILKPLLAKN